MELFNTIITWIVSNILTVPAFLIGLIVLLGYVLLRKPWYDVVSGTIKSIVGYLILGVGSGGLTSNFRPVLVGLSERFNINATVIDPYFGQAAVTAGLEETFGVAFSNVFILFIIAFIVNILFVKFKKITKLRSVFTTGHVQMQQCSTAFWLILFAIPALATQNTLALVVMALVLGVYWAVGTNLLVEPTQELTDGANFTIAHQQMFGVYVSSKLAEKWFKNSKSKKIEDIELPGWMSIFNENMVVTSLLMLLFFGIIYAVLGKEFMVASGYLAESASYFMYVITMCLNFAVYLAILQLGVRTFVTELTQSFKGIQEKLLPGALVGVDCAVAYGFGSPNAVPLGFLAGAVGQFIAIAVLMLCNSPVLIIAGFVPVFFDNATIAVYANNKGGLYAALLFPFISGLLQVFGSAFIAGWVGMSAYGGYLGMWDWAVLWPVFTIIMKYLQYVGVAIIVIGMLAIPQLQYRKNKDTYFLVAEDYEAYKEAKEAQAE